MLFVLLYVVFMHVVMLMLVKFNIDGVGTLYPGVGFADVSCGLINGEGTPRCW